MTLKLLLAAGLVAAATASSCASFSTCGDCIGKGLFCGWCSPSPTIFSNGTKGSQCQDQHAIGWHCDHLYSTDKCQQGYACNQTAGQCQLTAAGEGDTKANCEKHCTKIVPPAGLSVCDAKTHTCTPCKDYCHSDSDCPGSYCNGGLCHGSTCQQEYKCNATCSNDTPDAIVGTWRGVEIQQGFPMGEFDYKFQKQADGPQVTYQGPKGGVSTGSLTSDAATGGKGLTLTYTTGPLKGSVYQGLYNAWEPSDYTEQFAFYFGAPNGDAPTSIEQAMNNTDVTGQTVYLLSRCKAHGDGKCDFSSVFPKAIAAKRNLRTIFTDAMVGQVDPCKVHQDCSSCVEDPSKLCGFCSTKVVYADGSPGSQCAGFDSTGKPLGWKCAGTFSKEDCADHGCDWTDIKNPKCKVCTGPGCQLTAKECAKACVKPDALFKCNDQTKKCIPCTATYCTKDADCPNSYCQISGAGPWSCHGAIAGGCSAETACKGSCNSTELFYVCDKYAGQCNLANHTTPGADTKYNCEHACKPARPTGTWRGVEVSANFARGEWDVTFYDDNTVHWRQADGTVIKSKVSGADVKAAEQGAVAISGTVVTGSTSGTKFTGLFKIDTQGDDGIVFLLTWGQGKAVANFDEAMSASMFVMSGCNPDNKLCDFSSAVVA